MTAERTLIADTFRRMLDEELPNLFRPYLNPFVAQTCLCLSRYVETTWDQWEADGIIDTGGHQTFLANAFDEALSGAIKLARTACHATGKPSAGLIIDPTDRIGPFVAASVSSGRVEFLPGLTIVGSADALANVSVSDGPFGFVVLVAASDGTLGQHDQADTIRATFRRAGVDADGPLQITCVGRESLTAIRGGAAGIVRLWMPDIVVFDESLANAEVPFGAFTARKKIYDHWNKPGKGTFHSTTFQPNTISTLHFMNVLKQADPDFHDRLISDMNRLETDLNFRGDIFRQLYSPMLYGASRATGCDVLDIRASGSFVYVGGRRIFDGVSGVACSVRGHNPPGYAQEMEAMEGVADTEAELAHRLRNLTGLQHMLPATSGGTAVENALKVALVAQYPRRHVLALKSGFGGKTLFALTGTWKSSYKEGIDPLYADVMYVDPFADDALAQIDAALAAHPVAVVQMELIQGVGGVRRIPEKVARHLSEGRRQWGYLLLVDEVQTGMYRTGPFALSGPAGVAPDLLVVGKGVSDMMFPFALVLYSAGVHAKIDAAGSDLPTVIRKRYGYEYGYKTALNVLRHAEKTGLAENVAQAGATYYRLLKQGLASCKAVREVRIFGLLIGIELNTDHVPRKWARKKLFWFYLLGMLRHAKFPVLVGFCQYEPNILKITPPLNAEPEEIEQACATMIEVLKRPFYQLAATVVANLIHTKTTQIRSNHDRKNSQRRNDGQGNHTRAAKPAAP